MNDPKPHVWLLVAALACAVADYQPGPLLSALDRLPSWRVSIETSIGEDRSVTLNFNASAVPAIVVDMLLAASEQTIREK